MTSHRFDSLGLKPALLKAVQDVFKYETMSKPQASAIPVALEGKDVLLRSSTGSGKTLTFLLAGLQRHLSSKLSPGTLGVLVLTPLREVALQTREEAAKLLHYLPSRGAQVVIGGTDLKKETRTLATQPCDILIATPGRLLQNHLADKAFAERMKTVHTVILDEADRMLDPSFAFAVRSIFQYLPPKEQRQAMLVSATIDARVQEAAKKYLRDDFVFLTTVVETTEHQVNDRIDLHVLQVQPGHWLATLEQLLVQQPKKTLVFMPATSWTSLTAQLLRAAGHDQVHEFHGGLSQPQRERALRTFTSDPKGVLIASDAAARGLDIQDIDRIIQIGVTDVAGFVQRSGRTARAGRKGQSIWVLGTDETNLLKEFGKIPFQPLVPALVNGSTPSPALSAVLQRASTQPALRKEIEMSFRGTLGSYASNRKRLGWTAQNLVDAIKQRFEAVGMKEPPKMSANLLQKMNLTSVVF